MTATVPDSPSRCPRASIASVVMDLGRRTSMRSGRATVEASRRAIVEPGEVRPRTAARNLPAMPPRDDEQSAAVSDSPLRASAVFLHARQSRSATTSSTSIMRRAPVGTTSSRLPAARTGCAKSACFQRSEMTCVTCHDPHDIPRGARPPCSTTCRCARAVTPGRASRRRRCAGSVQDRRPRPRHLPRLPHAEAPRGRCRARGDDRPLHSAAESRPAICWRRARKPDNFEHGDYRGEVVALLPADAAVDAGERAVPGARPGAAGLEPDCRHPAAGSRPSRGTSPRARTSTTSLPARTRRRRTTKPISAGARRRSGATPASRPRSRSWPLQRPRWAGWRRPRRRWNER